jgi:hypothetical protein
LTQTEKAGERREILIATRRFFGCNNIVERPTSTRSPSMVIVVALSRNAVKPSANPEGAKARSRSPKRVVRFKTLTKFR